MADRPAAPGELVEARARVARKRAKYFQQATLVEAFRAVAATSNARLSQVLAASEAELAIDRQPLMGLSKRDLRKCVDGIAHNELLALLPEIEAHIRHKTRVVASFHGAKVHDVPEDEIWAIPQAIAEQQSGLGRDREESLRLRETFASHARENFHTLEATLDVLDDLVQRRMHDEQFREDELYVAWCKANTSTIRYKLQALKCHILKNTYTKETVRALAKIRESVEGAVRTASKSLQTTSRRVKEYEAVGMGFDEIVSEYRMLAKQLENKQWTLDQLH